MVYYGYRYNFFRMTETQANKKTHFINLQENLLIDYLKKHPKLVAGKYDHSYTYKNYVAEWEDSANILNAVPGGSSKNWKSWRKTWQDKKSRTKKKISIANIDANKTGGGPSFTPTMTETEEKWYELIIPVAVEGDSTVEETCVEEIIFEDDICDENVLEVIYEEPDKENIIPILSQESVASRSKDKSMTSGTPQEQGIPKKMTKAGETANAVKHFKTITVEEIDVRKAYYQEKLKKLDEIIGLKERKCKAIERLAEAVDRLSR